MARVSSEMLAPGVNARDTAERETPASLATCWALTKSCVGGGLDGRVLFLARGCSRAFEASQFAGFQEGIYFLEDTSFDISLALSRGGNFPCSDVGCYSGSEIMPGIKGFPSEFQSTISSPTWFYP